MLVTSLCLEKIYAHESVFHFFCVVTSRAICSLLTVMGETDTHENLFRTVSANIILLLLGCSN